MPLFRKKNVNFFKKWTPEMAYVLGFFAADGSMFRNKWGIHYVCFYSTDRYIIERIRKVMGCDHKVSVKRYGKYPTFADLYLIQIGSKEMYDDLIDLGMKPNKSLDLKFPKIPSSFMSHFVRGYFDGDGHISPCRYRKKGRNYLSSIIILGFTCGCRKFLEGLRASLMSHAKVKGGTLFFADGHRLCYSKNDSRRLYEFMYRDCGGLFLERKKSIFDRYFL